MSDKNLLLITPFTRINDNFVSENYQDKINSNPVGKNITHSLISGGPNCPKNKYQADFYKYIGCDIVCETVLNYPYPYITEKTIRPIGCKRMFIILWASHTLKLLHSKGFKTFDDFIDETYDTILDPQERFLAVAEEAKKICEMPTKKIIDYLKSIETRFEHNYYTLKKLENTEIQELKKRFQISD